MRLASFALFSAVLVACVGDPPAAGDAGKMTGEEGGPCFSNFTCNPGLVCNLGPNTCVKPGTDGSVIDTGTDGPAMNDGGDAAAACLTSTMVWWECENNTNDHFNIRNATSNGAIAFPTGKVNRACDFVGGSFQTNWANGSLPQTSVEFWIQSTGNISGTQTVMMVKDSNDVPVWAITQMGKTLTFSVGTGTADAAITAGSYNHVAFVFDGGKLFSYVNGNLMTNAANAGPTMLIPSKAIAVGADINTTSPFTGQLDEIAIYRRALSALDVASIAQANNGICRMP